MADERSKRGRVEGVRSIALVRADGLDDFIFLLPALEALRSAYPGARIALLAKTWHARFLQGRECGLDEVVIIPDMPGFGGDVIQAADSDIRDFFAAMRERRFDIAFQLHGGGPSSIAFVRRLHPRISIGAHTPQAPALDRSLPRLPLQNERLRLLELAALAGAMPANLDPRIALLPRDVEELSLHWRSDGRALVVLQPGANDIRGRWPPESFAEVADAFAGKGAQVAIHGSEAERDVTRAVIDAMTHDAVDLTGALTISGLAGLLARASLVVANDTGPLQLAQALGTPTVGIYRLTSLLVSSPLAWEGRRMAVSAGHDCPVCGMSNLVERCPHEVSFVADVTPEEVIEIAFELFTPRDRRKSARGGERAAAPPALALPRDARPPDAAVH